MVPGALAVLVGLAFAASPPSYEPEPAIKTLLSSADAALGDVSKLIGTPLEKEQAAKLKETIDDLKDLAQRAADASQKLAADAELADQLMTIRVKGRGEASFDDVYDEAAAGDAALRKRRQLAVVSGKTLKNGPAPAKASADELSKRRDEIDRILDLLSQADSVLGQMEDALKAMDDARSTAKQSKNIGGDAKYQLGQASAEAVKAAADAARAAPEAKGRVDLLGTEPQTENHDAASRKLQPLMDDGRTAARQADVVKNRAREFSSRYAAFLKASARFDDARKTLKSKSDEAAGLLSQAEDALSRLKNP